MAAGALRPHRHHDNCSSCHNGVSAPGQAAGTHQQQRHVRVLPRRRRLEAGDPRRSHAGRRAPAPAATTARRRSARASNHIPTSEACSTCHSTLAWTPATFSHAGIAAGCASCHDGVRATGRNATHIFTTTNCESCHATSRLEACDPRRPHAGDRFLLRAATTARRPPARDRRTSPRRPNAAAAIGTTAWVPATGFTHDGITGNCSGCHDGVRATGKGVNAPSNQQQLRVVPYARGVESQRRESTTPGRRHVLLVPRWRQGGRQEVRRTCDEQYLRLLPRDERVEAGVEGRPHAGGRRLLDLP